jgi:hypothetical protein
MCVEIGKFDPKLQSIQLREDFAKGIESARREVFDTCRALDDFFHTKQAIGPKLLKHMITLGAEQYSQIIDAQPKAKKQQTTNGSSTSFKRQSRDQQQVVARNFAHCGCHTHAPDALTI